MEQQGIQNVLRCLPQQVRSRIQQLTPSEQAQIQEIRLRAERPACILLHSREKPLDPGHPVSQRTIEQTFQAVCEYSVYRYAKEIAEGFVTIAGGNRVGIAGSAVYREGKLVQMRHISGLNFRVSHAVTGCAEPLFRQICPERPSSLLLAGAVGSGKTTMLRDLCRLLGASWRLTLVDERSEIAAVHHGVPQYDVGLHTDVLDGFPRAEGLLTALRVLTPEVLVCDEISTEADAQAILRIHGSGVPVVASAHGTSLEDLERRPALKQLLDKGVFRYAAVLSGRNRKGADAAPGGAMMKLLGLLLVVCCGAGIGVMQAMRLRQTHRNLEQLCRMLRELSVQMAFRSLTVQELLEQLCREPAYAAFQFPVLVLSGLEQGMPLADAWESGIRQDKAIPETGKNLLLPLGEELGASDLDGQTATLSQYRRQLEPYAAEAGELCRRKQRLYCSLGVLGGFLAAILLC